MCKNWLLKIKNPSTQCTLVIYEDGRVYVDQSGPLIGNLKSEAVKKIKKLVAEFLPKINQYGYEILDRDGFIIKFWDHSVHKRTDVAVKGWIYEEDVLRIICDSTKFKKLESDYAPMIVQFFGPEFFEESYDER